MKAVPYLFFFNLTNAVKQVKLYTCACTSKI